MQICRIVITGGPCAGKSSALDRIRRVFSEKGWTVLVVPETATELISSGIAPWTCGTPTEYQRYQIRLQTEKERIYLSAAENMPAEKVMIVCDRGLLDNLAYMSKEDFRSIISEMGQSEVSLRDGYDAVFHLITAADGAELFYTTANNTARTETVDEALDLDRKVISAWTGHPHFRIIDNSTDFEGKMARLISEISAFLGEPEPVEIERKFLVEYPDIEFLESIPNCQRTEIIQTYLQCEGDREIRIRQRGLDGSYMFYRTEKRGTGAVRFETETRISAEEYLDLLLKADPSRRPVRKTRFCLSHESRYFEIDVYPFWNDRAIVEIELKNANEPVVFPDFIRVIREVTGENEYKNSAIAARIPLK
ncbi:MAG: AAA family ATPase [Clostridia bacterium]|nr:AAA family ATPase [Clostridia bacterium]